MLYITSYCSKKSSITGAVQDFVQFGFTNIELTGGTDYNNYSEEKLLEFRNKYNLNFLIHNYFPPQKKDFVLNLASNDDEIRRYTLRLIEQAVKLTRKFNQNIYSIHAGYANDLIPEKGKDGLFLPKNFSNNSKDRFYETLEYIADYLLPKGFQLAIENAFPTYRGQCLSFLSSDEDIFGFLDFVEQYPNIGLLLDLGHLNVASYYHGFNKYIFLEKIVSDYHEKILELHVSQNTGKEDSHQLGSIDSFEINFIQDHVNVFKDIPIVLEWHQNLSGYTFEEYTRINDYLGL